MAGELASAVTAALESPSALVRMGLGLVLLLFGRRLFWLLVALLGFALGLWVAEVYLDVAPHWRLVAALTLGLLGALAAMFLQRVAITVGGALVAGYATWWYLSLGGAQLEPWQWLVVALAALVGTLVARLVVDVALIALSCLAGATLALQGLDVGPSTSRWLFIALLAVGAAVQFAGMRSRSDAES